MILFDSLTVTFVLLLTLAVIPNLFYTFGYQSHIKRKAHFFIHYFAFIASMYGVVFASNGLMFLFFWEIMSLTSWQLILTDARNNTTIKAARFYFFMTHFGFTFLLLFFLIATNGQLELDFSAMKEIVSTFAYPTLLFFFLILGFLSKAGVVPMHVWLPYAHPAAPSPVSALMSGVMIKIAIYGMFRFLFDVLNMWQLEWGVLILVLGAISSLVGVLYALSEHDIKALLANHSIENIGIILIGFGMGMIFMTLGLKTMSAFAFIAALFHVFNHMSFKSLLFLSAGSVIQQSNTHNIEHYGGLIKSMPITAFTFLLASISISALPPTNGFLSEWMIFQSLLGSSTISDISLRLAIPFSVFALSLTGGLAIACFVKVFGISFLGLHRSTNAKHALEVNIMMRTGMILMALVVVSLMLFTPAFIYLFDQTMMQLSHVSIYHTVFPNIWSLHALSDNKGVVSPLILLVGLIVITVALLLVYKVLKIKERRCHTWACGYNTNAVTQYSATGFAGPIRIFFAWLYKPKEQIEKEVISGHQTKFVEAHYQVHVKPLFEHSLYDNMVKFTNRISYYVYRFAHFEQTKYAAMIFNMMLTVLFSYRIFTHDFSWATFALESVVMIISIRVLIIGVKR
ncbi:proton-conducting transporter transmembrane domain-containing protein [Sulfurospirillum sp. 1612]|uniref:proton-conducting transporter transmembrane domain-containing protein n=1 Tax=Sulfurospirillum sp. 1612 TaxID=3094835 RepID=UPI002F94D710